MTKDNLILLTVRLYRLTLLFPKKEPLRYKAREVADDILASWTGQNKEVNGLTFKENLDILDNYLEVAKDQNWVAPGSVLEIQKEYAKINRDLDREGEMSRAENAGEFEVRKKAAMIEMNVQTPETSRPERNPEAARSAEAARPSVPVCSSVPLITAAEPIQAFVGEREDLGEEDSEDQGALTESQIKRQQRIVEFLKEQGQAQVWEIQKIFPDISKRTIRRDFRSLLGQGMIERVGERNKTYYKMKVILS